MFYERERKRERERERERERVVRSRQDITISRVIIYSVIIQVVKRFETSIKKKDIIIIRRKNSMFIESLSLCCN